MTSTLLMKTVQHLERVESNKTIARIENSKVTQPSGVILHIESPCAGSPIPKGEK